MSIRNGYDKYLKKGWYPSDSITKIENEKQIELGNEPNKYWIFYRSTDIERFYYINIDSLNYRKTDRISAPGPEFILLPIGMVTSPIWNWNDGKFNWGIFLFMTGVFTYELTFVLIQKHKYKLRTIDFINWRIEKLK